MKFFHIANYALVTFIINPGNIIFTLGVGICYRVIIFGSRKMVVATHKLVPCVVRQAISVFIFHYLHYTGFGTTLKSIAKYGKIYPIGIIGVIFDRFVKTNNDISAPESERYHTPVFFGRAFYAFGIPGQAGANINKLSRGWRIFYNFRNVLSLC